MCGIAGIVDLQGERAIDRAALTRMTNALAHRGPDGEGFYTAPGIGFGHRRLAVIDRDGGAQPYHCQVRDAVLNYNGEIYNFRALAKDLERKGLTRRTQSDTEVLAEGLAREGSAFVHQLRGMFAFAFWEPDGRRLTLARDRLGERPLFYAETNDGYLVFASELGALLASGLIARQLNTHAVADYLFYGFVPDPASIIQGVYKLPPAHTLTVTRGARPQLERYWKPAFAETRESSFHSASRLLLEKLDEAVATQMISDAPLGAFLSGGVDSAGVVTSMHAAGGKLVTCTVGFNADAADETEAALALATRLGADHHEHAIAVDAVTAIDAVAAAVGEPFADSSALPSYFIAREARSHVTVALTGDGGDEIFAGYRRYPFFLAEQKARRLAPAPLRSAVFGPAAALYPKLDWAPRPARLKTTLQALAADQAEGYAAALAMNWPTRAAAMASHDLRKELKDYNPSRLIADAMADADTDDDLSRAQYADLVTWLPGRILTKLDRTSMAHGLETRPPLLDHSLVEWAGRLPPTYKLQDGVRKRILKEALAPRLGWPHLNRPKQGFEAPLTSWLRKPKDNPVLRLNASRRWRDSGLFNEAVIDRMARDHQRGGADCAQELWTVIMFDAFLRVLSGQR